MFFSEKQPYFFFFERHIRPARWPDPPVPAILPVEPGRTGFPAELAAVPWRAGAGAVGRVALAVDALAVALAARAPQALTALAAAGELVAGGVVAVALDGAVPPRPAGVALAPARHGVAQ